MKKHLHFFLIVSVFSLFTCQNIFGQGTVETHSFNSPSLGVTKYYKIYLPPDYYQSSDHYPVVYFFRNHQDEWFNTSDLKSVTDGLIESGLIGDMILVGANSGANAMWEDYGAVNMLRPDLAPDPGIGTGKFEDYIVNDLINHIENISR